MVRVVKRTAELDGGGRVDGVAPPQAIRQEFFAQPRPLPLVPFISLLDVRSGRRPNDDLLHRLRLRMRLRIC